MLLLLKTQLSFITWWTVQGTRRTPLVRGLVKVGQKNAEWPWWVTQHFFFLKNSFIGVKEHTIYYMHLKRRNFISFDIRIYPWNHHCSEDTEYPLNPQTLLCALGGPHHCRSNHWSAFCRYRNLSGIWPILYRCKCKQRNLPPPPVPTSWDSIRE